MSKSIKAQAAKAHVTVAVPLAGNLEAIAHQVAGAFQEIGSLSQTLGELTIEAGKQIVKTPSMLAPFVDACNQLSEASGLTTGSTKAYMTHIRSVIRAMIDGYKPKAGQSLRSMYENAPKSGKGGAGAHKSTGPRLPTGKVGPDLGNTDGSSDDEAEEVVTPVKVSPADTKRDAMVALFGHADDELMAALAWAAKHEMRFVNIIKAQIAFDATPSKVLKAA